MSPPPNPPDPQQVFSDWTWPNPVYIKQQVGPQPAGAWNPYTNYWDRDHVMPVITSSVPQMNSTVNVDEENLGVIKKCLVEAARTCSGVFEGTKNWQDLLQPRQFFQEFEHFIDVTTKARRDVQMWFGSVESKLRHLVVMLRRCPKVSQAIIWPAAFPRVKRRPTEGSTQTWYIGVRLKEGMAMALGHFKDPLDMFTDLCQESARQLSATNFVEMKWDVVERSKLPAAVTATQERKASYAAAVQGSEAPYKPAEAPAATPASQAASVLAAFYQQSPLATAMAGTKPLYQQPATPELAPHYYPALPSPRDHHRSPATYSARRVSDARREVHQSPYPATSTPHMEQFTTYPPVTTMPPPAPYSPHHFTSPPPPVPPPAPQARKPGCSCDRPGEHQHQGQGPRREQPRSAEASEAADRLRSVSWTSDKFPPPGLGLARVSHQDQLPPSVSPGYRDVSGVVPLPQHCDTSVPPPPHPAPPPLAPEPTSPLADLPTLTFDSARMSARRKDRLVSASHNLELPRTCTNRPAGRDRPGPLSPRSATAARRGR